MNTSHRPAAPRRLAASRLLAAPLLAVALLSGCAGDDEPAPQTTSTVQVPSSQASAVTSAPTAAASPAGQVSTMDPAATGSASVESVADGATASADATASVDTAGLKQAATAKLPHKVGGYTGQVSGDATGQAGMYTGSSEDDMVMAALRTGNDGSQLIATLQGSTKTEHASCGKVQNVAYCVIPLGGGNITLNGTDQTTVADLGKLADQLYASLA